MGKRLDKITPDLAEFIADQKLFFVGTAAAEGRVNISPKGTDSFRIINENKIVWLNLTGSGNETAAHVAQNERMTVMFCAFEGPPKIIRLYGSAMVYHERDAAFHELIKRFPTHLGSRQLFEMHIDLVQISCGFGVPIMPFKEERETLNTWAEKQGKANIEAYWKQKNTKSIDGFETGIFEN